MLGALLGLLAAMLFASLVVGILWDGKQVTPPEKGGSKIQDFSPQEERYR